MTHEINLKEQKSQVKHGDKFPKKRLSQEKLLVAPPNVLDSRTMLVEQSSVLSKTGDSSSHSEELIDETEQIEIKDHSTRLAKAASDLQRSWALLKDEYEEINKYFNKHFTDAQKDPNEDICKYFMDELLYKEEDDSSIRETLRKNLAKFGAALSAQLKDAIKPTAQLQKKESDIRLQFEIAQIEGCLEIMQKDIELYQSRIIDYYNPSEYYRGYNQVSWYASEVKKEWFIFRRIQEKICQQVDQFLGNGHRGGIGQSDCSQPEFWPQTSRYQLAHACDVTRFLAFKPGQDALIKPFLVSSHKETEKAVKKIEKEYQQMEQSATSDLRFDGSESQKLFWFIDRVTIQWDEAMTEATVLDKRRRKIEDQFVSPMVALQTGRIQECLVDQGNKLQEELMWLHRKFAQEKDESEKNKMRVKIMDSVHQLFYAASMLKQEIKILKTLIQEEKQYNTQIQSILDAEKSANAEDAKKSAKAEDVKKTIKQTEELTLWVNEMIRKHADHFIRKEPVESIDNDLELIEDAYNELEYFDYQLKKFHVGRAAAIRDHTTQEPASKIIDDRFSVSDLCRSQKDLIKQVKPTEYETVFERDLALTELWRYIAHFYPSDKNAEKVKQIAAKFGFTELKDSYFDKKCKMYQALGLDPNFDTNPAYEEFQKIGLQVYKIASAIIEKGIYLGGSATYEVGKLKDWAKETEAKFGNQEQK